MVGSAVLLLSARDCTTEKRHTISCTTGAYVLLTCSIVIDYSFYYLLVTSIVVSRLGVSRVIDSATDFFHQASVDIHIM